MCTLVYIMRPGLRAIECGSVRELGRWFNGKPPSHVYPDHPALDIDRMASHCLCPVDLKAWAKSSGYELRHEAGDYEARKIESQ